MRTSRTRLSKFAAALALGVFLYSGAVWAGEFVFGEGASSLATDDDGKLTSEGRKSAVKKLDKIPGEDAWDLQLHATLESGRAEGPLYIEFWQKVNGEDAIVYRHEIRDYDGSKYISENIILEGNLGFNKDRSYSVKAIQVNANNRDVVLAKGSIDLINTGRQPTEDDDMDEGDDEEERESASQDELDSLAGPDSEMEDKSAGSSSEAPPPAEPSKKGCSVGGDYENGFSGLLVLAMAGLMFRRRRE